MSYFFFLFLQFLHGIKVREPCKTIKKKTGYGLQYGKKILNRQKYLYKKEQEQIVKMKELREQGFSYWEIADIFNSMKIPTKTKRGKWHSKTIYNILKKSA